MWGKKSAISAPEMDLATTNKNEQSTVPANDTALCFASGKVKKSERLAFRLSSDDYQELKKLVEESNTTLSTWFRELTLNTLKQQKTSQAT